MKTSQELVAQAKAAIKEVGINELATALKQDAETVLIDVREPAEYSQQHITGSVNYPRGVLEMNIHNHPKVAATGCEPKMALQQLADNTIYVICRSGARSALAAESLQRMGFTKVFSVDGGMQAWLDAALPVKQ
ncbi:rhodanese-like domain-containing protein [Rheinheimera baltica]|uniref:Rhodanese-like domain-containing protein n=1 Tax=Rheinheimera baltica TaxID=67576 RepID=A0ABT9I408_9GAMM|nr:rhodanese-like domain-containing protein [Rheinheimera baltica]MDP5137868.1 rhodanese-like domain-containing protein [Rheinheimera baltica]MDP5141155.1 rhodanese-like domain-containing protein [Rheinheimera baltica]MDP5148384.1 rhodanese-like domain-containing protein [Rheinheimera baltica]MDP5189150.1 rhodanese-like domain-containing protein [Rheinheimera baltica]